MAAAWASAAFFWTTCVTNRLAIPWEFKDPAVAAPPLIP
jgi:hypothetical protein